jgi:hypothetical protein
MISAPTAARALLVLYDRAVVACREPAHHLVPHAGLQRTAAIQGLGLRNCWIPGPGGLRLRR